MERIYKNCCGIDVHKKLIVACLLKGRNKEIRECGASTNDLVELSEWLKKNRCEMIAMESTGSYWKPLYNIFEIDELPVMVVNPYHMKNLPGRKTDVKDAEWIADLCAHGLLRASYIPDREQRELRELLSYRKSLTDDRTRELNRLQKILEGANIKLSGTISNILGLSGRAFIESIIAGEVFSEERIVEMKKEGVISKRLKASNRQLANDLNGVISSVQRCILEEIIKHIDEIDAHLENIDIDIDTHLSEDQNDAVEKLSEIPGIAQTSARAIISVIGTDMNQFPTERHLCSWAGLSPGQNESAGKKKSGKTSKGNKLLKATLVNAAHSAAKKKDSYFCAQFNRLCIRRGKNRAYVAVAHSMLIAIYHVLKDNVSFIDLGADYYSKFNIEKKANSLVKKIKALGYDVAISLPEAL